MKHGNWKFTSVAAWIIVCAALLIGGASGLTGCNPGPDVEVAGQDEDTSRPAQYGYQRNVQASLIEEGKAAYAVYCVGCHGENFDGNGEAAKWLHPRPRNLVNAKFKFSSTRSGQLPTDDDLRRTISNGLRGSAMPPFNLLPSRTIDGLVAYVKTLSLRWQEQDAAAVIPVAEDPYARDIDKSAAIARGEEIYHGYTTCWSCHPAYVSEEKLRGYLTKFGTPPPETFRPNLYKAVVKPNSEGELIWPPDFHRDTVKAGMRVTDLHRSIAAGITGTAMPTWVDSMHMAGAGPGDPPQVKPEDLWALAYYTQSLLIDRPPLLAEGKFEVRDHPRPVFFKSEWKPVAEQPPPDETPGTDEPIDLDEP